MHVQVTAYQSETAKTTPPFSVETSADSQTLPAKPPIDSVQDVLVSTDYYGAGSVLGEVVVLEHRPSNQTAECDTDVQAFFISLEDLEDISSSFPAVKEQLWRINGISTATELLAQLPTYQVG